MSVSFCTVRNKEDNLRKNLAFLREQGKPLMPVVKADAYGHGLLDIVRVLHDENIKRLAAGIVAEAVQIRQSGFKGIILSLMGTETDADIEAVRAYDIIPVVHDWANLTRITGVISRIDSGCPTSIAIKCDTGMNRLGFAVKDIPAVVDFLSAVPSLRPDFILSQFAAAELPAEDAFTEGQTRDLQRAFDIVREKFPHILMSMGNSAGVLAHKDLSGDFVRPGIALYGGNPFYGTSREDLGEKLLPVMEVSAPIMEVHDLAAGESLGHGRAYVASEPKTIAVVGIGYADGFRTGVEAGTSMCVLGKRAPVVGRVSMQMTCLDVTHIPGVKPDDVAYVLGGEGDAVTMHDIAGWWNTIPSAVLCQLGKNR